MIINHKLKLIYLHLPKTAGHFIRAVFAQIYGTDYTWVFHDSVSEIDDQYKDYETVISIRDPLTWYLSFYNNCTTSNSWEYQFYRKDTYGFKQYLNKMLNVPYDEEEIIFLENFHADHIDWDHVIKQDRDLYLKLRNRNLDAGWYTYWFIYMSCVNHEWIFENCDIQDVIDNFGKYASVNHYVRMEYLIDDLFTLFKNRGMTEEELAQLEESVSQIGKINCLQGTKFYIETKLDDWATNKIKEKDRLLFWLYDNCFNKRPELV